jgi:hypothetical protein
VADFEVTNWQEFVTPSFTLAKGQNDIVFRVAEGCEVPAEVEVGSEDRRCLSVLFQRMELLAADEGSSYPCWVKVSDRAQADSGQGTLSNKKLAADEDSG